MTAAVTGHRRRMVRLVETAAKKECFHFSAEGQYGQRVTDRRWKFMYLSDGDARVARSNYMLTDDDSALTAAASSALVNLRD